MKPFIFFVFICSILSCAQPDKQHPLGKQNHNKPLRYGMITGIKPDRIEYYRQLHANPWPRVLAKIKECNIRNYSIYIQKIDNRFFLFSYFEYVGDSFGEDMKKMAADPVTQRWWKETDPCQLPLQQALEQHQIWMNMSEVFHVD